MEVSGRIRQTEQVNSDVLYQESGNDKNETVENFDVPSQSCGFEGENVSAQNDDVLCQPCASEGENVPAESYCVTCNEFICSSCLRAHRKLSLTKNHVIKPKHEIPKGQTLKDPCSELCATHETEIVKFYCEGHNEVGCGDCMILEHKACTVQLVPKVSSNYGKSEELSQTKLQIEQLRKEIISRRQKIGTYFNASAKMNMKAIQEIKSFRKNVNRYLFTAEAELLKDVQQLKRKDESLQKELEDECQALETDVKKINDNIEIHSDKENQLFIAAKSAQKRLKLCQASVERTGTECETYCYNFIPSKDLMALKENKLSFGSIAIQFQKGIRSKLKARRVVSKCKQGSGGCIIPKLQNNAFDVNKNIDKNNNNDKE